MAQITIEVGASVYGLPVARAIYGMFEALGFESDQCHAAALSCVFVRIKAGRRATWYWLGR